MIKSFIFWVDYSKESNQEKEQRAEIKNKAITLTEAIDYLFTSKIILHFVCTNILALTVVYNCVAVCSDPSRIIMK